MASSVHHMKGGRWGVAGPVPDSEPSPSMAQDLPPKRATNRGSGLREGTRPEERHWDSWARKCRAHSGRVTVAGATPGPRRGCPGSGALGQCTERYREVPAQRTSRLPLLARWITWPQCVKRQVIQKSFGCGSGYVLLFIYSGAWCSTNSP